MSKTETSGRSVVSWTASAVLHFGVLGGLAHMQMAAHVEPPQLTGSRAVVGAQAVPVRVSHTEPPTEESEEVRRPVREPVVLPPVEAERPPVDAERTTPRLDLPPESNEVPERRTERQPRARAELPIEVDVDEPEMQPRLHDRPFEPIDPVQQAELDVRDFDENLSAASQSAGTTETVAARPIFNPQPVYPATAVSSRLEGRVLLEAEVTARGRIAKLTIVRGSGHDVLDRAARSAVKTWRFVPAQQNGRPVPWTVRVPIRFRL